MLAVIREKDDGTCVVSFHQNEGLPDHYREEFKDLDAAMSMWPLLNWQDPDDDTDGDVLKVAAVHPD
jgi:hypothetical protein